MEIKTKFNLREIVYLIHDLEQKPRMVTAISIRTENYHSYELSIGTTTSYHQQCKISRDENTLLKVR